MTRSLIDQELVRDVARLRAEHGPLGAVGGFPLTEVPIWGYHATVSPEEAERMEADRRFWERVRASTLVLHLDRAVAGGGWVLVAHEPVAIADQDPELWGDQA